MFTRPSLIALLALTCSAPALADVVPFDDARWAIAARGHRVEEYLGHQSLFLDSGMAMVQDSVFRDGVIEYDIAVPAQRGFAGCMWRIQDDKNHEQFYIRPHQSGNPDATQYTPSHGGLTAWQLYHGPGYAARVAIRHDVWMHVKIVVAGDQAEVYLDSTEPILFIHDLKRDETPGMVGVNAFSCPTHYANFSYEAMDEPPVLRGTPPRPPVAPPNVVTHWEVSNGFPESLIQGTHELSTEFTSQLTWTTVEAETNGLVNLAPTGDRTPTTDAIIARLKVRAIRDIRPVLRFGYSDRVRVYLNGRLLYAGNNGYLSRDYRYLGTIGLFDELSLPLNKGDNELWIVVAEDFGGWGIMAAWENPVGLTVTP